MIRSLTQAQAEAIGRLAPLLESPVFEPPESFHLEESGGCVAVEAGAPRPRLLLAENGRLRDPRSLLPDGLREEVQRRLEELALEIAAASPPSEHGAIAEALGVHPEWLAHELEEREEPAEFIEVERGEDAGEDLELLGMSNARLVTIAETPTGQNDYSAQLAAKILRARQVKR